MSLKLTNNARSILAVSISDSETVIRVKVGHGVKFPVLNNTGDWFPLALEDDSGNIEYLRATAREGDSITVQRGAEGSQRREFSAGDLCELRLTAGAMDELQNGTPSPSVVAAVISDAAISS